MGGFVEAWRAVHTILIQQRQRGIAERRRTLDERFGQGGATEERKRGSRVQLDVHKRNHEDTKGITKLTTLSIGRGQDTLRTAPVASSC